MGVLRMKKKIIIGFALTLGLGTGIYIYADQNIVETRNLHGGMMATYENYEDHLNSSDLVVIGEVVGEPKNVLTPFGEDNQYLDGHHLSKIKISQVIKGEETIKKVTDVREPYFTVEKGLLPGEVETFYGDYTKMEKGNQYLLFLQWEDDWGAYGISSAHEGKFNLDGKDKAEQKMVQKNEKIKKLKEDILKNEKIKKLREDILSNQEESM